MIQNVLRIDSNCILSQMMAFNPKDWRDLRLAKEIWDGSNVNSEYASSIFFVLYKKKIEENTVNIQWKNRFIQLIKRATIRND